MAQDASDTTTMADQLIELGVRRHAQAFKLETSVKVEDSRNRMAYRAQNIDVVDQSSSTKTLLRVTLDLKSLSMTGKAIRMNRQNEQKLKPRLSARARKMFERKTESEKDEKELIKNALDVQEDKMLVLHPDKKQVSILQKFPAKTGRANACESLFTLKKHLEICGGRLHTTQEPGWISAAFLIKDTNHQEHWIMAIRYPYKDPRDNGEGAESSPQATKKRQRE